MKKIYLLFKILISLTVFVDNTLAIDSDTYFNYDNNTNNNVEYDENGNPKPNIPLDRPFPTNNDLLRYTNPQILKDRFELNANPKIFKEISKKNDNFKQLLDETFDVSFLMSDIVRQIRQVDIIYIHPKFVTSVLFPEGTKIIYANSSTPLQEFNFSSNLLLIQPKKDFVDGNILVTFSDKNKNYITNIILKKYTQNAKKNVLYNRYVFDDNFLSLNYQYVRKINYSPIEILEIYFKLNGNKAINNFKKNGDFDTLIVKNVAFYIIRDDNLGKIDYQNVRFSIKNTYDKADSSIKNSNVVDTDNFYPTKKDKK
ncbi:hypothetical protein [Campylobacter canadensis]|uniref:hypothetical protein n=1 Tax=Campylobacter canadensis TaxID=449520 RepID=UPI001CCE54D5|nr:hypothetical protein [Campylobacter canadensis]MBZ8002382.1 hypothetical protein [Campylobacter canadensis]